MRGTQRRPGADLRQLPVGLDLRAINLAEGLRAAFAVAVIILLTDWLAWPALSYAALAAYLACLCDSSAAVSRRIPTLLAFTALGALSWAVFGLCRGVGPAVLPLAGLAIFCNSFARVWGLSLGTVGNILSVVVVLALDRPLDPHRALEIAGLFAVGGLWAVLLTMALWRMNPYQPVQRGVADAWHALAAMAGDMRVLAEQSLAGKDASKAPDWEAHARAHRRATRDAIEQARSVVADTMRARGPAYGHATRNLIRLEAADQIFGALIALSHVLEHAADAGRLAASVRLLRVLRPLFLTISRSILSDRIERPARLDRALAQGLSAIEADPGLGLLAQGIGDRLRIAIKLAVEGAAASAPVPEIRAAEPLLENLLAPVRANLTWNSTILRHATRAAVMGVAALAVTMIWPGPFQHWLTITVVLTMQPFFAATWQRALERIAGTLLGAAVAAGLAVFAHDPLTLAALMFPLLALAFSMRQVSYGAFIACLTPGLMIFIEASEPGYSAWTIAVLRAAFSVSGGLAAVMASLVLWPSWEPGRLRNELRRAIDAHARYADAVFAVLLGEGDVIERARREAGVASNNLEASLSRALNEPRRPDPTRLEVAMLSDATLRRLTGALQALQFDRPRPGTAELDDLRIWRAWIVTALTALAEGRGVPGPRPAAVPNDAVFAIARQIELMDGAVRRLERS